MQFLRKHWRTITLLLIVGCYITFVFIMDQRSDLFIPALGVYLIVTALLFLNSLVGVPGIILHSIFKKEQQAIPFYKGAIALGSKNVNILTAYGLILLRDFKPTKAKQLFEEALKHSNHYMLSKTITANISLCLWQEGEIEEAAKKYEDLYYYPDLDVINDYSLDNLDEGCEKNHNFSAQDFTTMAFLMHLNGENEKAEFFSKVSLEKLPTYGPAYDNLGQIYYSTGHLEQAITFFKKGIELKPTMNDSYYFLAKIYTDLNDLDQAKHYLKQINKETINGLSTVSLKKVKQLEESIG